MFYRLPTVCMLAALTVGCATDDPTVSLTVYLRTDYQPVREFTTVEVFADALPKNRVAQIDGEYVTPGQPVATFEGLSPAFERNVTLRLLRLGGDLLTETTITVVNDRDIEVTLALTRDCANLACPTQNGEPQRCLAGQCTDQRCLSGNEPTCGDITECMADADCEAAATSNCAKATCQAGICFEDGGASATCPSGQVCDLTQGCVPDPNVCVEVSACDKTTECISAECVLEYCIYENVPDETPCTNGACFSGICVPAACDDGRLNNDETDVDCGGSCPENCAEGKKCMADFDCISGVCDTLDQSTCEPADTCWQWKSRSGRTLRRRQYRGR